MSRIVMICPKLSKIVQFHHSEMEHREKRPDFEAFLLPWVYIPKKGQRPVEGLCGPFTGLSAFSEGHFSLR
ncbi:MAG: hypothetical protein J6Y80_03695, partial [Victivallales bacterium]|nr:hypothetical protein [Victivallales bacterium]